MRKGQNARLFREIEEGRVTSSNSPTSGLIDETGEWKLSGSRRRRPTEGSRPGDRPTCQSADTKLGRFQAHQREAGYCWVRQAMMRL